LRTSAFPITRHEEANERLVEWVTSDRTAYRETVTEGIENSPSAFLGLFEGDNVGKQLVEVN
jgi:NADPH2:quinone reductase